MKRLICCFVMLSVLMIGAQCFAKAMYVGGTVTDAKTGLKLPGVKLVWYMAGKTITVYTNSAGAYWFLYNNWCDSKLVALSKTGYLSSMKQIYEGSCWGCTPECPPEYAEWGCRSNYVVNFKLTKNPLASALTADGPVLMSNNKELLLPLLTLFSITYCQHNICQYECLYQAVVDLTNGPEFMFGHQTRPDIELPDCPDVLNFVDFVNDWLDAMWEKYYGDNFPDEEPDASMIE